MDSDRNKIISLNEEMRTSRKLIEVGLGELQEINYGNDFYHLPHQLLASGIERLLKCYICLVFQARNGVFPDNDFMKKSLSHDLGKLKSTICTSYFNTNQIPLLEDDFSFLHKNETLERIIRILSDFGRFARYYHIDVITGSEMNLINPTKEWQSLERDIEDPTPYINSNNAEALTLDYFPRVNKKIIERIEHFIAAISRQFTLGGHNGKLKQYSIEFSSFRNLTVEKLGTTDYRRSVKSFEKKKITWEKRSEKKIFKSKYPTKKVNRESFQGEWPFRSDSVIIEVRDSTFCIVNIMGYDYALNGSAEMRYNYPDPHAAGMAIVGISIGPFLEMAFSLAKT